MADEHARPPDSGLTEVDGVRVAPPVTEAQARQLAAARLLVDSPAGFNGAWQRVREMWNATVDDARLTSELIDQSVDGEWSFIQTLRHLLFVTDGWILRAVVGQTGFHPLGIPPHFIDATSLALTLDATPALEEVVEAREQRFDTVIRAIDELDEAGLLTTLHPPLDAFVVLGALQVVLVEELAHHHFATRDLAKLRRQ